MKIKLLVAGLLGLFSATAFAQKGELSNAQEAYTKYTAFKSAGANLAMPNLTTAKTSIDKAAANEKTANMPQTFALKGAIYATLAVQDTVKSTSAPLYATAEEAVKKAQDADTKGEYKNLIADANRNLAQYKLTEGVNEYKEKKYDQAYNSFDRYRQIFPDDTNAMYFTGLSALNSKKYDEAITNYNKLVTTKFSQNPVIYYELSDIYLTKKDTAGAVKTVTEGIAKFPSNADLRKRQIELYLRMGKQEEVLNLIETAIKNDPKNKSLYYYGGFTYTQLGDAIDANQRKTKDAAAKEKLGQTKIDYYTKAADMYKKTLEIDPDFFEANLNLGYVLMKPGIDAYNAAQQLPATKQKEFDAALSKASLQLDAAKPYLLKAVELNPKSVEALNNLKNYYLGKRDMTNANDTQKKIDA
ncbi:MAG: hypothetical protein JWR67_2108, partial [Mucilaginibacter sp.]|nr:hypothetical protein [Mucilaginibacter sp.]